MRDSARRADLCQLGCAVGFEGAEATGVLRVPGVQPPKGVQLGGDIDDPRWPLLQGGHVEEHHLLVQVYGARRAPPCSGHGRQQAEQC